MAQSDRTKKLFPAIFAAFVLLHLGLLATQRLYPFVDLPNHLASATIVREIHDPSSELSRYYGVEKFPQPNTMFPYYCRLEIFPSVEIATRAFFCLYAILLPVAVLLIVRKAGGNQWFSLLSFPLLYNVNVTWGFVGFLFSIPLVLLF